MSTKLSGYNKKAIFYSHIFLFCDFFAIVAKIKKYNERESLFIESFSSAWEWRYVACVFSMGKMFYNKLKKPSIRKAITM